MTDEGEAALKGYPDPEEFMRRVGQLYRKWKAAQPDLDEAPDEAVAETAATTLEEAEELAWTEIEKYLRNIQPYELQALVAALLKAMDYHVCGSRLRAPTKELTFWPIPTHSEQKSSNQSPGEAPIRRNQR